jgi:hypothetical protein
VQAFGHDDLIRPRFAGFSFRSCLADCLWLGLKENPFGEAQGKMGQTDWITLFLIA